MPEIYKYLYENEDKEPHSLLKGVAQKCNVDVFEAIRIYDSWKQEYMKAKYKASGRAILR